MFWVPSCLSLSPVSQRRIGLSNRCINIFLPTTGRSLAEALSLGLWPQQNYKENRRIDKEGGGERDCRGMVQLGHTPAAAGSSTVGRKKQLETGEEEGAARRQTTSVQGTGAPVAVPLPVAESTVVERRNIAAGRWRR